MLFDLVEDGFFAALAAIGFAAISNPPRRAYPYCAVIAAIGHAARYFLVNAAACHFVVSNFIAALIIGSLAVFIAQKAKCPAETVSFPALLPMIPGMYAYRTFQNLILCLSDQEQQFHHYFYLCAYNGLTCLAVLLLMAVGVTIPIFIFKNISFHATRQI